MKENACIFQLLCSFPFLRLPLNLVPSVSSKPVVTLQTQIWLLTLNKRLAMDYHSLLAFTPF